MTFKNSVRLLLANFSLFWKLLAYVAVSVCIGLALIAPVWNSLINASTSSGALALLKDFFVNVNFGGDIPRFFANFYQFIITLFDAVKALFVTDPFVVIYVAIVLGFVVPIIFSLCELATLEGLYGFMSSLAKYGFLGLLIKNLGKSFYMQIIKFIILLPVNLAISVVLYYCLSLTTFSGLVYYFAPYITCFILCLMLALRYTIVSCFLPSAVASGTKNVFKALKENAVLIKKRFLRVFSTYFGTFLIFIILTTLLGFGALVLLVPFGMLFSCIISMVTYYECKGNRYYVDMQTIITPKRLEEADKFCKLKELI